MQHLPVAQLLRNAALHTDDGAGAADATGPVDSRHGGSPPEASQAELSSSSSSVVRFLGAVFL